MADPAHIAAHDPVGIRVIAKQFGVSPMTVQNMGQLGEANR
jgi:hypothetical protein